MENNLNKTTTNSIEQQKASIQELIEKYEAKIESARGLKKKGIGYFSNTPTHEEKERLNVRIYERQMFVEDLKKLFN